MALASISIVVKPSRLSIGLFWLSGNPSIKDWCTTLHFTLQNIYHFVGAANSTTLQDYFQSQIIALLPRLTALRIQVQLVAYHDAMYDQTLAALSSLQYIKDISFKVHTDRTTYSTQVLRMFASSIRTLDIIGGDSDWFIGDGSVSKSHPFLDGNPKTWSFPNLRYLDLRNAYKASEIYAQISFDMSLVTLVLRFDTFLGLSTVLSLPQRRVQRLVLWGFVARTSPKPHFEYGPSADNIDFVVSIWSTTDPPLVTTFEHLAEIFCSLSRETTRKVTWKLECSTPELRTQMKIELQKPSVAAILQSLVATCQGERPQWELEEP